MVTATSKTVITVNPDTREAMALARHAQMADFFSSSLWSPLTPAWSARWST